MHCIQLHMARIFRGHLIRLKNLQRMTTIYSRAIEVAQHFGRLVPRLIKLYHVTTAEGLLPSLVPCSPEELNNMFLIVLLEKKLCT